MALRARLKWVAVVVVVIFIGLQFTTPRHTNPPVDPAQTLAATTSVPPEVSAVFDRSCIDCHSPDKLALVHLRGAGLVVYGRPRE